LPTSFAAKAIRVPYAKQRAARGSSIRAASAAAIRSSVVPRAVSRSNHASQASRVAVTIAAGTSSGEPRRAETPVVSRAAASAASNPAQAMSQW
jgi:hypothetical protein